MQLELDEVYVYGRRNRFHERGPAPPGYHGTVAIGPHSVHSRLLRTSVPLQELNCFFRTLRVPRQHFRGQENRSAHNVSAWTSHETFLTSSFVQDCGRSKTKSRNSKGSFIERQVRAAMIASVDSRAQLRWPLSRSLSSSRVSDLIVSARPPPREPHHSSNSSRTSRVR